MSEDRQRAVERFWGAKVGGTQSLVDKYGALESLATCTHEDQRKGLMRRISRTWPGALREVELVAPARISERARCVIGADAEMVRRRLLERGELGWFLCGQLHGRLDSLRRMRARAREHAGGWDYLRECELLRGEEAEFWPSAGAGAALETLRPSVRLAYLALAWSCGASLPLLNALIFERRGSWDARPGDPAWASEAGPREGALARALADMR